MSFLPSKAPLDAQDVGFKIFPTSRLDYHLILLATQPKKGHSRHLQTRKSHSRVSRILGMFKDNGGWYGRGSKVINELK